MTPNSPILRTGLIAIWVGTGAYFGSLPQAVADPESRRPWTGRVVSHQDGSASFLGRYALPVDVPILDAIRMFFVDMVGSVPDLQVQRRDPLRDGQVVHLAQMHADVRVRGGDATVAVRNGVVVYARMAFVQLPTDYGRPPPSATSTLSMARRAHEVIRRTFTYSRAAITEPPDLEILPENTPTFALRIDVATEDPPQRWRLWVDPSTLEVIRRELRSAEHVEGTVRMSVDADCQDQGTESRPMPHIGWAPGEFTDAEGFFRSDVDLAEAEVSLTSPYFRLRNHAGQVAGPWRFPLAPSPAVNDLEIEAPLDQTTPFYHAHVVRDWMRGRLDVDGRRQKTWSEEQVTLNVNIGRTCNATYNGAINFFQAGNGCINTGRASTIVYHEYGHGIHDNSSDTFDGQVSEGIADFTAATIRNSPSIAGIRGCDREFRTCRNNLTYCGSGCDHGPGSPVHASGQVICAVWWKLRELLVERYGYDEGVNITDKLFLDYLTAVTNMSSSYEATISVDEDDDNDPSNGTLHSCEINRAFADDRPGSTPHFPDLVGRIPSAPSVAIEHTPPGALALDAHPLALEFLVTVEPGCSPTNATPTVNLVLEDAAGERVDITVAEGPDGRYTADLSALVPGRPYTYYLEVGLGGLSFYYPNQSRADVLRRVVDLDFPPYRQTLFIGSPQVILQSNFEDDDPGWQTLACDRSNGTRCVPGARSDWRWWRGGASTAGGPAEAHSGSAMWATNPDGTYTRRRLSQLLLPTFDASGFAEVRLQFWRFLINADVAAIEVNGRRVFDNRAGAFFWRDPTWTFTDVDLTAWAAGQPEVEIAFVIDDEFDDTFELGGWHIDDLRIVGTPGAPPTPSNDDPDATGRRRRAPSGDSCRSAPGTPAIFVIVPLGLWLARRRGGQR